MSHEFYQIMVGAPTMSLYSWKQLAHWSIEYSCLTKDEKHEGYQYLDNSWKKFCQAVVDNYDKQLMVGDEMKHTSTKARFAYGKPEYNVVKDRTP
jgi:adenosine deaminase CECR1